MGYLPQINARLLTVTRGTMSEDYDVAEAPLAPVWQGFEDAYVQSDLVSTFIGNELRRVMQVTLFLSEDFPLILETGDILTYEAGNPDNPQTLAGRVQNVTDPARMAVLADYYKVALEEVNVP